MNSKKEVDENLEAAENLLIKYANDMNSGTAHSGDWRDDIADAEDLLRGRGIESEYKFENGLQIIYIGGVRRN